MTRLQADLALLGVGIIWGFGFVAQKVALDHLGPFTFVAIRFLISALVVLPLALREKGACRLATAAQDTPRFTRSLLALCGVFSAGVLLQQYGMQATNVVHTSFLTGLYVVMTPLVGWALYRHKLSFVIVAASLLSLLGIVLLSGGDGVPALDSFGRGDFMILICACFFALHVNLIGHVVQASRAPFTLAFLQYLAVALLALPFAFGLERVDVASVRAALWPLLFASVVSGGVGYTLQIVAQQHTPSADAAIILSSESLFGGLDGIMFLGEKITVSGVGGVGAIMAAIALIEAGPVWQGLRRKRAMP